MLTTISNATLFSRLVKILGCRVQHENTSSFLDAIYITTNKRPSSTMTLCLSELDSHYSQSPMPSIVYADYYDPFPLLQIIKVLGEDRQSSRTKKVSKPKMRFPRDAWSQRRQKERISVRVAAQPELKVVKEGNVGTKNEAERIRSSVAKKGKRWREVAMETSTKAG